MTVPASKSHTIRALLIAGCADGESVIANTLRSADTDSCVAALRTLGVRVTETAHGDKGTTLSIIPPAGGAFSDSRSPQRHVDAPPRIDVGNSGTTLYFMTALAALRPGGVCFDGDESIRRRSASLLLEALCALGATVAPPGSEAGDDEPLERAPECAPYCVCGPLDSGRSVRLASPTSQYLSALLLASPLIETAAGATLHEKTTTIELSLLNERPYVDMTCWWLDRQGISYGRDEYRRFVIPGGQRYRPFSEVLPGDYSSATFWFCAAAVTGGAATVRGLSPEDVQGDRGVLSILARMGCDVRETPSAIRVAGRPRRGGLFDLNAMPDALPALAVAACFAPEPVRFVNVAQARAKETDRIAVMVGELRRLGATVRERQDGIEV
ncbi:MAG: 3-phosphoshikimate 1-carboxyvinyltransferase, partial [Spirochaetales bacterium]|nr:3-phosphoshikimate 1-carboxyvinyltransferase [Spirochaetales bacterium]